MKKVFIVAINFYRVFLSGPIHQLTGTVAACRFYPTCSEYAKISISQKGIFKGLYLSFARLLKCQPFYSGT